MRTRFRLIMSVLAGSIVASTQVNLPTVNPQTQFSSGQNVVPVFEGWIRNTDGTFTFVFGYFNRNWKEEPVIPAGPDNRLDPGPSDRGQPTYFLPRRQPWVFRVQVPKDWGQRELVWTISTHGRPEKAYAQLLPEEEIRERLIMSRGNLNPGEDDPNQPPSVRIAPVPPASVSNPVSLAAFIEDDGLPKPRAAPPPRAGAIPKAQTNSAAERPRGGLSVTWFEYRGPARVTFDPPGPIAVAGGQAVTTAHFTVPGTYVLRATASDSALQTSADVTVMVKP
jgi:hypothetical protein